MLDADDHLVLIGNTGVDGLDGVLHVLDDELDIGRLSHLERGLPDGIVGNLVANAEDAVGAQALDPRDGHLAMKQTMVDAKQLNHD